MNRTVFALCVALVLAGCFDGASALAGKWVPESGQQVPEVFVEERMELLKNGTGIGDNYGLTWTATKGRLTLNLLVGYSFAYDYKISGATLILTNDDGISVKYKKE